MKPEILHTKIEQEFFTSERCHIIEVANSGNDEAMSIARARVEPGVTTEWHKLNAIAERYLITSGRGIVEVGDMPPARVTAGDIVVIPAFTRQRITNVGADDLLFYAICTPRFVPEAYISLDGKS